MTRYITIQNTNKKDMQNLKKDLEKSKKILVTSHINCDQDGISSALSTRLILEKNFSKKEIVVNIESELQENISFLKGFSEILTENLFEYAKKFKPDFIIFTDSRWMDRFTENHEELKNLISEENIKTLHIDHHKSNKDLESDYIYNNHRTSCAEEVYHLFVNELELSIDKHIADIILTGMIFDTGVFSYTNHSFRETAEVVSDLVEKGANIEKILAHKNLYTKKDLDMITELNKNLVLKDGFCYSHISEEFLKTQNLSASEYKKAYHAWMDLFLRNIEGCPWGFVVRPSDKTYKEKTYEIIFRAQSESKNVREIAEQFDGGGHDLASGGRVKADSVEYAIEKILSKIL
jgi:bifunctional oligoribonuclease and PAP phosphatase NrnA